MNIKTGAWTHPNPDIDEEDGSLFGITLHEAPRPATRPLRKRLNYMTICCAICAFVWMATYIWELVRK